MMQDDGRDMASGMMQEDDPFSLDAVRRDAAEFRLVVLAYFSGALALAYLANVFIVWRGWWRVERHRKALRASEERYRDLFDNSTDLIQSVGADGRFQYVNRAWSQTLGYSELEAARMDLSAIVHPESRVECMQTFDRVLSGDRDGRVEAVFVDRNGKAIAVEGSVSRHLVDGTPVATRGIFRDVTARLHAEERLRASLREKEVLLKEIHHRVKNNLQLISSLMSLHLNLVQDELTADALRDSQARIRSIALIHENLYGTADLAQVELAAYLRKLMNSVGETYGTPPQGVRFTVEADEVFLDVETATPCGLIVSELVSNSLKHAFPDGRTGEIRVELRSVPAGEIRLTVSDDGVGLPEDMEFPGTESLGTQLVATLVDQLEGTIAVSGDDGAAFEVTFTPKASPGSESKES